MILFTHNACDLHIIFSYFFSMVLNDRLPRSNLIRQFSHLFERLKATEKIEAYTAHGMDC